MASNDESAGPSVVEMSTARLEAFSDGVFAIAITLLVLNLELHDSHDLGHEILRMWPSLVAYLVTFGIVGVIWMNHHLMFHYITRVDRVLMIINLMLLMSVAFLAWPTAVLADAIATGESQRTAAVLYGSTLVIGGIFFNAIWVYASSRHRHLGDHISPDHARDIRRKFIVGPFFYLFATVVGAFSAAAGLLIYAILLAAYMFEAGAARRRTSPVAPAPSPPPLVTQPPPRS